VSEEASARKIAGAIAADYYMVGLLSRPSNDDYSSRAGNAAYCVADESVDAFRRFHTALYTKEIQPSETGTTFPDNAKLTELAREAGVVGKVPDCIKAGKYTSMVDGLATATGGRVSWLLLSLAREFREFALRLCAGHADWYLDTQKRIFGDLT